MARHRILLAGGGHSHVEVLRRFAQVPHPGVEITVVDPHSQLLYSAMVPGVIAGHYTSAQASIDIAGLCARAGARFIVDRLCGLDLAARCAHLASGRTLRFETLALDIGAVPSLPGVDLTVAVSARPFETLLESSEAWLRAAQDRRLATIAIVGAGAAGIELLLALQYRLREASRPPCFVVVSDRLNLPRALATRLMHILRKRGVRFVLGAAVRRIDANGIDLDDGTTLQADRVVIATGGRVAPLFAQAGLACAEDGSVQVDAMLRSTSHAGVFASGDCATLVHAPRPKAGVFAVRQGPVLAANLRAHVDGRTLQRYDPQKTWLAIVTTGERCAIATRGRFAIGGRWLWHWKDRVDRGFVRRYDPDRVRASAAGRRA